MEQNFDIVVINLMKKLSNVGVLITDKKALDIIKKELDWTYKLGVNEGYNKRVRITGENNGRE